MRGNALCPQCSTPFKIVANSQKYCSATCRRKVNNDKESLRLQARRRARRLALPPVDCGICSKSFAPKRVVDKYCSPPCRRESDIIRTHERKMAQRPPEKRQAIGVEHTCPICQATFVPVRSNRMYCDLPCEKRARLLRDQARDAERARIRAAKKQPKPCRFCGTDISHRRSHALDCVDCSEQRKQLSVQQREKKMTPAASVTKRKTVNGHAVRACKDCGASITQMFATAVRCKECAPKRKDSLRASVGSRASQTATKKSSLKRRDPVKLADLKERPAKPEKVNPDLPNFAGDWFPGWHGCYSPNLGPEDVAQIEKYFGPPPDPEVLLVKHKRRDGAA